MPLIPSKEIVLDAYRNGYAVAAINTQGGNYEILRACIEVAHEEKSPIIVQVYPNNTPYYGLDWIVWATKQLLKTYNVPVAVHLDHGKEIETVLKAIELGFSSVMLDYSELSIEQNIKAINQVRKVALANNVSLEAEIGALGRTGESSSNTFLATANLEDVNKFLNEASVDMLALAVGNAHGHYTESPTIDIPLIKKVKELYPNMPLVLHGATGIPNDIVTTAIRHGMAKINFGTVIREGAYDYALKILGSRKHSHYWQALRDVKDKLKEDIREIIQLIGSSNKA